MSEITDNPAAGDESREWENFPTPPASVTFEGGRVEFCRMTPGNPDKGFVPGYHFRIFNSAGDDVGHVNVRVGDTEHVRLAAGHIGFGIDEEHRGNHHAANACLALAPWISSVHQQAWITVDPDNIASIRSIERIGGRFVDEVDVPEGDPHHERGSHRKKRFLWSPGE